MLGVTILAILVWAHPYQSAVTIPNEPFSYALLRMREAENYKTAKTVPTTENPQIQPVAVIPSRENSRNSSRTSLGNWSAQEILYLAVGLYVRARPTARLRN